jgi:Cys-rich protein (TIGR01571 family)
LIFLSNIYIESLFDICASPKICCKGFCCTSCLFGDNAAKITNGSYCLYCCGYLWLSPIYACGLLHMGIRAKMREKYGLQEEPSDCITGCLLSPCAACQEAREIISRERTPNKVRTNEPTKDAITTADSEGAASPSNSSHAS